MLGARNVDQESQDDGYVQPIGDLIACRDLPGAKPVQSQQADPEARHGKDPAIIKGRTVDGQQRLKGIDELECDDDPAGK